MATTELRPIPIRLKDFEGVEERIKKVFREVVYWPLMREIKSSGITAAQIFNASTDALSKALRAGRVSYSRGAFSGRFSATVSRQLKTAGAKWDRKLEVWRLPLKEMPPELRAEISTSEVRFEERMRMVDKKLAALDPSVIASSFRASDLFDKAIYRTDRDVGRTLEAISIAPKLSPEAARKIRDEWQTNLELYIKDFADAEILELRKSIRKSALAGNRHEAMVDAIRKSYGVTERKAKFLARQETNLLVTKLKESRYADAGVHEYRWRCVAGSPKHPVRPRHRQLDGSLQRFDTPPNTAEPNQAPRHNNPGQDFNCFPGSTALAQFHDVKRFFRRWYPGPLTSLVLDTGATIEATPNHPMLTPTGWKALQALEIGDHLTEAALDRKLFFKVNEEDTQPTIQEMFNLTSMVSGILSAKGHAAQFHGDGSTEEVDVVAIDSCLPAEVDRFVCQALSERLLAIADEMVVGTHLSRQSHIRAVLGTLGLSPDRVMGRLGQLLAVLGAEFAHAEDVCLRSGARLYAALQEHPANHVASYAELLGESHLTGSGDICGNDILIRKLFAVVCRASDPSVRRNTETTEMLAQHVGAAFQYAPNRTERSPFSEKFSRVVDKRVGDSCGHWVYNLETEKGWYAAQGFIVKNCRCVAIPIVKFHD